jgi:NAD(P)-dependent dehydrogenase (short-subunit alcohol dehydrogenase family)
MKAFITGGASGIGLASAQRILGDGGEVAIMDRSGSDDAVAKLGNDRVIGFDGDVTNSADVDSAINGTIEAFDGLDCVVTSAGIVRAEPALDADLDFFNQTLSINILGSFLVAQRAARHMANSHSGSIIFIGSVYGEGGAPERTAYCASKGAIHNMTRSLAVEWGPLGIRVNAVAPTGVRTPMVQNMIEDGKFDMSGVKARTPLGRLAEPEEVAAAIAFLASAEASMVNGIVLPVDGGWTANGYPTKSHS